MPTGELMKKLLIIGAGDHSRVVFEVAKSCGFSEFMFLDDSQELLAQGRAHDKIGAIESLRYEYDCAFVSIGSNTFREKITDDLLKLGYKLPILIHPTAFVSETANIGAGTLVCPKAVIGTSATVGRGCIISASSVIDHNTTVGDYSHIDAGAVCESNSLVRKGTKVSAGDIVRRI